MRGRKPTPSNVTLLRGNPSKRKRPKPAPTSQGRVVAPPYLSPRGRRIFSNLVRRMKAARLWSIEHSDMAGLAALRLQEVEELSRLLETGSAEVITKNVRDQPMIRGRPAVAMRDSAVRSAMALLSELGLSPTAAGRIARIDQADDDPLGRLLGE